MNKIGIWMIALLPLLFSCQDDDGTRDAVPAGTVSVRLAAQGMAEGNASDEESKLNTLRGYRFENGVLEEVFDELTVDEEGVCRFQPTQPSGVVYFWANASEVLEEHELTVGKTTLDSFLSVEADSEAMTAEGILMTGKAELSSEKAVSQPDAVLKRSVARIDLDASIAGVEVHSVRVKDMATMGYVNTQETPTRPEAAGTEDLVKTFEHPFKGQKATLFYVCEQSAGTHEVEVMVTIGGAWHRLRTILPAVVRNTVYTLKVYGNGADVRVKIMSEDWDSGISSDSGLIRKGRIDREASKLSDGVRLSETLDTVYVPYWKSTMDLVLQAESGLQMKVNGKAEGVTFSSNGVAVNVSSANRMPGTMQEYVYLDLYQDKVLRERVVLAFAPNPLRVQGRLKFDGEGVCDFKTYVDGELAILSMEEGMSVKLELDNEEDPWVKLDNENQPANTFRLLGGWKPNDPNADGREQTARLIFTDSNKHAVTYTIKRKNWGLPVVNINGTWWCKYNLRGNVKSFEDQISIAEDPVPNGDVGNYLRTCTEEQFKALLGDQYQGGNPKGMKVKHDDNDKFYYDGFQDTALDFGALPATEMAPDGYEIPDYDDYRFFTFNDNMELKLNRPDHFNNGRGQRLWFSVTEREVSFDGLSYGTIKIYDYQFLGTGARWTILGLGGQYGTNPGELSNKIILLATSGKHGLTWFLEGYGATDKEQGRTWFKYAGNGTKKTRTIRCIKTPVEYIYGLEQ